MNFDVIDLKLMHFVVRRQSLKSNGFSIGNEANVCPISIALIHCSKKFVKTQQKIDSKTRLNAKRFAQSIRQIFSHSILK